jgi:hypothetical protein
MSIYRVPPSIPCASAVARSIPSGEMPDVLNDRGAGLAPAVPVVVQAQPQKSLVADANANESANAEVGKNSSVSKRSFFMRPPSRTLGFVKGRQYMQRDPESILARYASCGVIFRT